LHITDSHKALLLTLSISGTIVLSMFNFHISRHNDFAAENFYEIEHEEPLTKEELIELEAQITRKAETNKAFNETTKEKRFEQAYKLIEQPKDYIRPDINNIGHSPITTPEELVSNKNRQINIEELQSFSKINDVLKKQDEKATNANSTMHYSLVNRTHLYLPTPIYLCEIGGKIIVNITVNAQGDVVNAYLNTTSTSRNECLIEHAIEYAKAARFNANAAKASQIGSITFYFTGKR